MKELVSWTLIFIMDFLIISELKGHRGCICYYSSDLIPSELLIDSVTPMKLIITDIQRWTRVTSSLYLTNIFSPFNSTDANTGSEMGMKEEERKCNSLPQHREVLRILLLTRCLFIIFVQIKKKKKQINKNKGRKSKHSWHQLWNEGLSERSRVLWC